MVTRGFPGEFSQIPVEEEILNGWGAGDHAPLVTILCNTYNHAQYLEDALKGFLTQKTKFAFEVLVHDDASTDGTNDILLAYADRYPSIIKPIIQEENQYSKGLKPTLISFPHAKGSYIAFCEGDDFWNYEYKLQHQIERMEAWGWPHLCFHPAFVVERGQFNSDEVGFHGEKERLFGFFDIIKYGGGFCPTPSLMISREAMNRLGAWLNLAPAGDYFLQIAGAEERGALYIPESMAVYRRMSSGSWSEQTKRKSYALEFEKAVELLFQEQGLHHAYDPKVVYLIKARLYMAVAFNYLKFDDLVKFEKNMKKSWSAERFFSLKQVFLYIASLSKTGLLLMRALRVVKKT